MVAAAIGSAAAAAVTAAAAAAAAAAAFSFFRFFFASCFSAAVGFSVFGVPPASFSPFFRSFLNLSFSFFLAAAEALFAWERKGKNESNDVVQQTHYRGQ